VSRSRRQLARQRAASRADFDERLVGLRVDRADHFRHPRRLEKVLTEALAGLP
jgi:hypothetical protein